MPVGVLSSLMYALKKLRYDHVRTGILLDFNFLLVTSRTACIQVEPNANVTLL